MKLKPLLLVLIFVSIGLIAAYLFFRTPAITKDSSKLQITASFYPYYYFAGFIGGDRVRVINLTPAGTEPHAYELTARDLITIQSSKLLILNGLVEPWIDQLTSGLKDTPTEILIVGSDVIDSKTKDPHVWLSPKLVQTQVKLITGQLIKIDPENADYYGQNTSDLLTKLTVLDRDFQSGLSNCRLRDFVTSHNAFGYLSADYNLHQVPISGLSPDAEPSLQKLAEISEFVRTKNITYIFFESLVSPKLAQTLASEVGAKVLVLNPIEGLTPDEISRGQDYFTVMQANLKNLRLALDCK